MGGRWRHVWLILGISLVFLPAFFAPTAFGAALNWEFEAPAYDFGPVAPGSHATHRLNLTNTGEEPIEGTANWRLRWFTFSKELFGIATDTCSTVLEPGESCHIGLTFNPLELGHYEGELEVFPRSNEAPTATIALSGDGAAAIAAIGPKTLDFGAVQVGAGPSKPQTVTLKNEGNLGLSIASVSFTNLDGTPQEQSPFQVVGGSCQGSQAVPGSGGTCSIELVLAPSQAGTFSSNLVVADNGLEPSQSVELHGIGTPAPTSSIRLSGHPAAVTKKHSATFHFVVAPTGARTECELDHRGFKPCTSPTRYSKLSRGRHRFRVRVPAGPGTPASAGASFRWRIRPPA